MKRRRQIAAVGGLPRAATAGDGSARPNATGGARLPPRNLADLGRAVRGSALLVSGSVGAVALAVAGCGGQRLVSEPKPAQPIAAVVPRLNKAIADRSCTELARLTFSQTRPRATLGGPPASGECNYFAKVLAFVKGARFSKSAEYGTAAFAEGPPPKKLPAGAPRGFVWEALFVLDRDRKYRLVAPALALPQIGLKPPPAAVDGGRKARAVVAAIRKRDCRRFIPLISRDRIQWANVSPAQACKGTVNGKLFGPSVRATKDPKLMLLGQTAQYAFYGVSTTRSYFTLVMIGLAHPVGPPGYAGVYANTSNPGFPKK